MSPKAPTPPPFKAGDRAIWACDRAIWARDRAIWANCTLRLWEARQNQPGTIQNAPSFIGGSWSCHFLFDQKDLGMTEVLCESLTLIDQPEPPSRIVEPKNNDGRTHCYWCNAPTRLVDGGMWRYHVCSSPTCGR